jgi:hypothetical protein
MSIFLKCGYEDDDYSILPIVIPTTCPILYTSKIRLFIFIEKVIYLAIFSMNLKNLILL